MNIALINLGTPQEVFSTIEALYISGFYQKSTNHYFVVVREEFLKLYEAETLFDVHFVPIKTEDIAKVLETNNISSVFVSYPMLANRFDIIVNFSMTQISFMLSSKMTGTNKLGPMFSEKGKLILTDEWSQVLYADEESKHNFSWSKSEIDLLIFQRLMSKLKIEYQLTPIISTKFVKTFLESKTTTQMCVVIPNNLATWGFWSQLLLQSTKRLEVKVIKLFASDDIATKVMQVLVPMGIDVDIFDQGVELQPVIKSTDYYIGPPLEISPLLSLLQVPSLFVCGDWKQLYLNQTLNPLHFWQCTEGWEDRGTQLALALSPLIQKMINLEQIVESAKSESVRIPGLCYRYQGIKVQSTELVSSRSAISHVIRVLWQYYFYQADHFVINRISENTDAIEISQRIEAIGLIVRVYEFMKHHCLKSMKQNKLTHQEEREIKNSINDIQIQIDVLCQKFPDISSPAKFFRAKLSAMEEGEISEALETLVLTIQEAGSCYLAVKDLLEQSLLSYNNIKGVDSKIAKNK